MGGLLSSRTSKKVVSKGNGQQEAPPEKRISDHCGTLTSQDIFTAGPHWKVIAFGKAVRSGGTDLTQDTRPPLKASQQIP